MMNRRTLLAISLSLFIVAIAVIYFLKPMQDSRDIKAQDVSNSAETPSSIQDVSEIPSTGLDIATSDLSEDEAVSSKDHRSEPTHAPDLTEEQIDRLMTYLQTNWADVIATYKLLGTKRGFGDDSFKGYFVEFEFEHLSSVRRAKPLIGCSFRIDNPEWSCIAPQYEHQYLWPGRDKPIEIAPNFSDEMAFATFEYISTLPGLENVPVRQASIAWEDRQIIRVNLDRPGSTIENLLYMSYEITPNGYKVEVLDEMPEDAPELLYADE